MSKKRAFRTPIRFLSALLLCTCANVSAQLPAIEVLTERSPFTEDEDGQGAGGEATRFLELLLARAEVTYTLTYLPWRRAYRKVLEAPQVLIYPLARSDDREDLFAWIGELIPVNYYLFKLRSREDIQLQHLEDASAYRVGVVNFHVHHEYLASRGVTNLQAVNSNLQNLKKALLGRIDLFPISDGGLTPICRQHDIDCTQFEPIMKLEGISGGLYMAFSKNTDPNVVTAVREAYATLKDDGTHAKIFALRFDEIDVFNAQWNQNGQFPHRNSDTRASNK